MAIRMCASTALKKVLRERGWSQGKLARELGTSSGVVNRWIKGGQRPSLPFALRIEELLGVKASSWHPPAARAA